MLDDVVLGYADVASYEQNNGYFGAVVGRCANRLRNASFQLNGQCYKLPANNMGVNTLHGGFNGFDKKVWNAQCTENAVRFSCVSADGEEGFPGTVEVSVEYSRDRFAIGSDTVRNAGTEQDGPAPQQKSEA